MIAATLAAVFAIACDVVDWNKTEEYRKAFQNAAPRPEWWDQVSTEGVKIRSYDDLLAYWQNGERSKRQFFKAAYQAILRCPLDEDLVVNAVNLLPQGDAAYPYTLTMLEFTMARHFYYQRPVSGYLGKPGDTIGGIAQKLAKTYNNLGDYASTIELVERLLDEREFEINDQLLEMISLEYAEALFDYGRRDDAVAALETAIEKYNGDWENRLGERLSSYQQPQ